MPMMQNEIHKKCENDISQLTGALAHWRNKANELEAQLNRLSLERNSDIIEFLTKIAERSCDCEGEIIEGHRIPHTCDACEAGRILDKL